MVRESARGPRNSQVPLRFLICSPGVKPGELGPAAFTIMPPILRKPSASRTSPSPIFTTEQPRRAPLHYLRTFDQESAQRKGDNSTLSSGDEQTSNRPLAQIRFQSAADPARRALAQGLLAQRSNRRFAPRLDHFGLRQLRSKWYRALSYSTSSGSSLRSFCQSCMRVSSERRTVLRNRP